MDKRRRLIPVEYQLAQMKQSYTRTKNQKNGLDILFDYKSLLVACTCFIFIVTILYIKYTDKKLQKKMYNEAIHKQHSSKKLNGVPFYISASDFQRD
jgi:hypothetical protein